MSHSQAIDNASALGTKSPHLAKWPGSLGTPKARRQRQTWRSLRFAEGFHSRLRFSTIFNTWASRGDQVPFTLFFRSAHHLRFASAILVRAAALIRLRLAFLLLEVFSPLTDDPAAGPSRGLLESVSLTQHGPLACPQTLLNDRRNLAQVKPCR